MLPRLAPFVLASVVVCAPSAFAQEADDGAQVSDATARSAELAAQAEDAFLEGRYEDAIRLLEEAYASDRNPNMLYNIARVHEERGDPESALAFYRRFVVAPDVDIAYRREAQLSADAIEDALAAQATPVAVEPAQTEPQAIAEPPHFPPTSPMRPLGFTLAAIGGATVLGGLGVGLAAMSKQNQFEQAETLQARRELGSSARDLATAADALYISGAVLIVTGLVTAYVSPRRGSDRPVAQQLGVTFRGDGVGVAWSSRF